MNKGQQKIYQEFVFSYKKQLSKSTKLFNYISTLRVICFLLLVALVVYLANMRLVWQLGIVLVLGLLSFAVLLKYHNKIAYKKKYYMNLVYLNEEEINRAKGNLHLIHNKGDIYRNINHDYSSDLDIFGVNSLFQFVNRTGTHSGKSVLVSWLMAPASKQEIYKRQTAIRELSSQIRWCQQFYARAKSATKNNTNDLNTFYHWLNENCGSKHIFYRFLSISLPTLLIMSIIAHIFWNTTLLAMWLILGLNSIVIFSLKKQIGKLIKKIEVTTSEIQAIEALMKLVEDKKFQSKKLRQLQKYLHIKGKKSSSEITKLTRIFSNLEARKNPYFFVLVNIPLLHDIRMIQQLNEWKARNQMHVAKCFRAIGEIDTLVSIAGMYSANPNFSFPKIVDDKFVYRTEQIGHPLLRQNVRKYNNFDLNGEGKIAIITGSNMAGKSTFLRTLGINAVLAFMGAPVCAQKLELSSFELFTSMRTQDSLEENVSGFYAELKRIKQLFNKLSQGKMVFYLLDELLKGTNSQDRKRGIIGIISRITREQAFGLISTHDLSIAELAQQNPDKLKNFSFNSQIKDNELVFDYLIREGICNTQSAAKLMQKLGILAAGE